MLLRLWFLILCVLLGAFAPSRAGARGSENRTWVFAPTTTETRLDSEPQAAGTHQENGLWNYEHAPGCCLAAENAGSNIVYRALNAADAEALAAGRGLSARAPSGTLTAAEHVANVNPAGSPWISTTRNLDVARAYNGGNGMVAIDLSKVSSFQAEVWRTAPRVNGVAGLPYHRSIWAQEVTIFQEIPASAILGPVK